MNKNATPHQVLARKYRPADFGQLKGQDTLVRVITNAIVQDKLPNAYLLTGIRGVGKTTVARIIAKTINCSNLQNMVPCGICNNCVAMSSGSHPDIIELDAASRTGVNDIRDIIESTKFSPVLGRYKTYIIDEIHMLSTSAFNALLKTLEEPPAHLLFIFATTEFRKIPLTIISRCQKFDLCRLSLDKITEHLASICAKEGIRYTVDGLRFIAKFSEGSVRDSLSLLETMRAYINNNEEISQELINQVLGLPSIDQGYQLFDLIISGNHKEAIDLIQKLYYSGSDASTILDELLQACNKLSKAVAIKDFIENADLSTHEKSLLQRIAQKIDIEKITTLWKMLFKGVEELKHTHGSIDTLEMLVIRICHLSTLPSIENIVAKLHNQNNTTTPPPPLARTQFKEQEIAVAQSPNNNIQATREIKSNELVREVLESFPGAKIKNIININ